MDCQQGYAERGDNRRSRAATIEQRLLTIRGSTSVPALRDHVDKHGVRLGVSSYAEYLQAFQQHLARSDLRTFTYLGLRGGNQTILWELVASDTGTTALYNETRTTIWSFFRPSDPIARAIGMQAAWVEVIRTQTGWHFEEDWTW